MLTDTGTLVPKEYPTMGGPEPGDLVTVVPVNGVGWYVMEELSPLPILFGYCPIGTDVTEPRAPEPPRSATWRTSWQLVRIVGWGGAC